MESFVKQTDVGGVVREVVKECLNDYNRMSETISADISSIVKTEIESMMKSINEEAKTKQDNHEKLLVIFNELKRKYDSQT